MQVGSNATFRQDLADVLQENMLGADQFVGNQIMPIMDVGVQSGQFAKIAFATTKTKAVDDKKSSGSNYNQVQHGVTKDTFACVKRGLEEPVDDDDAKVLGKYFDAEISAADFCRYYNMLNREARIAAIAFSTAVMSGFTTAAQVAWDVPATAKPVNDVDLAKNALIDQINGMVGGPSRIIGVGNNAARADLRETADIKDRAYGGGNIQTQTLSEAQLAEIMGLDAVYFSGLKRGGSAIWSTARFGIYIVSESAQLRSVPHYGRTMLWKDSTPTDMMVESYRDEGKEANMIRVKHNSVEKLLTARCGHLITGIE